jgi:gliding motility-associated-like protein
MLLHKNISMSCVKTFLLYLATSVCSISIFAQQVKQSVKHKPTNHSHFENTKSAKPFSSRPDDNCGISNEEGKRVAKRNYEIIMPYYENLAAVKLAGKWGFMDRKGKEIIPLQFEKANGFFGRTTAVKRSGVWYLIDKRGIEFKKLEATHVNSFWNGKASIILNNKYAYINHSGNILPPGWITVTDNSSRQISQETNRLNVNCPQNIDFEDGNFNGWKCFTGIVKPPLFDQVSGSSLLGVHGNSSTGSNETILTPTSNLPERHEIIPRTTSSFLDPYGFFPINPPDGSNYCLKVGSSEHEVSFTAVSGFPLIGPGSLAEAVEFKITTPPQGNNFSISYQYAVVFEDPDGHEYDQKPRFKVEIIDAVTNQPVNCGKIEYVAQPGIPGFVQSPVSGNNSTVWYKPWSKVFVNLTPYPNRELKLKFTTTDCTLGGHWGYAYLDIEGCQLGATAKNNCNTPPKTILSGPPGFQTYNWWNASYTSIVATGQNVTMNNGLSGGTSLNLEVIPPANPTTGQVCRDTLKVTVEQPELNINPIADKSICESASVTLATNSIPNVTYSWSPSTGLSSTNSFSVNASPTDTTTYQLVATDNTTQCVARDTVVVNVKPKPVLTVNTTPFCSGATGIITVSGADSYSWAPSSSLTLVNPTTVSVNPTVSTNYSVTGTRTATSCTATSQVQVSPAPSPSANFTPPPPQCLSANGFTFTSNSSVSSGTINSTVWNFGSLATQIGDVVTQSFSAPGTYNVILTVVSNNNCSTSINKPVVVNPGPQAVFNPPLAQCLGTNNFTFNSNSTVPTGSITNYAWQFGDQSSQVGPSVSHTYTTADSFNVKLTVTSDKGCVDDTTIKVVVHPNATVDFITPLPQCFLSSGNLFQFASNSSIAAPGNVMQNQWDFGTGALVSGTNTSTTFNGSGDHSVLLISTTDKGCVDSIRKSVLINPLPDPDFVSPPAQCFLENDFSFNSASSISSGNITTYHWFFGDGNDSMGQNVSHHYVIPNQFNYQVRLIVASDSGCVDSIQKPITILPSPSVNVSPNGPYEICAGDQIVLHADAQAGAGSVTSYQWMIGGTPIPNATTDSLLVFTAGSYQVLVTNTASCSVKSISDSIIVNQLPTGILDMPDTTFICEGTPRLLQGSTANGYQWFYNGNQIQGATQSSYLAILPGVYTLELVSTEGCKNLALGTVQLSLKEKPIPTFINNSNCLDIPVVFNNTSDTSNSSPIKWYWNFGDGSSIDSVNYSPTHVFDTAMDFTVQLTISSIDCPSLLTTSDFVIPIESPISGIRYTSVNALKLTDTRLYARNVGNEFLWLPSLGLNRSDVIDPVFNYDSQQEYIIQIRNNAGCFIYDTLMVNIFDNTDIAVPSAFSPNADGHNDLLDIFMVGMEKLTIFRVFNRWGQLLFETRNPLQKWDGTFKGKKQPAETYVWIAEGIDKKGKTIMRRGQTILLR